MQALALLPLALCALQLCPAVLGGALQQQQQQQQPMVLLEKAWPRWATQVENFSWENCGPSSNPAGIKSLSIGPDPVVIPGNIRISASLYTSVALTAPLKVVVVLEKRLGEMWLKVPCVDQLGSCTYEDICALLDSVIPPGQPCPEPLLSYGLPCHCPFKAGTYNLPQSDIYIPKIDLPAFLTNGDYKIQAVIFMGDQEIACVRLCFSLSAGLQWFW
ncbi:ganglioside GM2 activator [Sceloporus undulatus]|uniref:ganglioside GM2 activator n=1 Tax=Sceloporus undulatus TaxID=8520 RepID=UPI001C4A7927|nr:ganglioside GM2 activator [Sceloporus undulatus]